MKLYSNDEPPQDYLQRAEKALDYLTQSEAVFARYKALHQAEKERTKIVKASLMIESQGKTVSDKENWALSHKDYQQVHTAWHEAMEQYYLIEAKRTRAELTIEMYRSVNSAIKRGNI